MHGNTEKPLSNASLAGRLVLFAGGMFAFGFFVLPPLYDVFCEITGFGGRTNSEAVAVREAPDYDRTVRVEFMTTVNNYAPWEFRADVDSMTVHPGKMYYATFTARNLSSQELIGQAMPERLAGLGDGALQEDRVLLFRPAGIRQQRGARAATAVHRRPRPARLRRYDYAVIHVF